jgi:2-keto-3-deoxy-L-rhamnonate aldolase RhmA
MNLRDRILQGDSLCGTFQKTPDHVVVELLNHSGMDFLCLDAEHAPLDRGDLDKCIAVAKALGFPVLVRVPAGRPEIMLGVLDSGATGVVVPHVDSAEKAAEVAKAAHFGLGGRGYAGATRWAGIAGSNMPETLARSRKETIVLAQIEEPAGVEACEAIAAIDGIDGLFIGPADLSVSYGKTDTDSPELHAAYKRVGEACKAAGKGFVTWAPDVQKAKDWRQYGVTTFLFASEYVWMLQGARNMVSDFATIDE